MFGPEWAKRSGHPNLRGEHVHWLPPEIKTLPRREGYILTWNDRYIRFVPEREFNMESLASQVRDAAEASRYEGRRAAAMGSWDEAAEFAESAVRLDKEAQYLEHAAEMLRFDNGIDA
jgi:hypothetical protein